MTRWQYAFTERAEREFAKLPRGVQRRILTFITERVLRAPDPTQNGKALTGEYRGVWRYRVGDYRVLARLERGVYVVRIIRIGHRSSIYERKR